MVALAASLGPWRALGIDDVGSVLERQLRGAQAEVPAERAALVRDLLDRGFYYQAWSRAACETRTPWTPS